VEESVEYSYAAVFKGTYRHRIDAKGRLPIPAAFRRALPSGSVEDSTAAEERVVVTLLDQCLAVYAPAEWARLETQLAALPSFNKQVKALTRLLASRAADCEIDVQGRILLPPALRQAAGLARDAVIVGVLNRFEVWSPEAWDGFVRESERLLDDVSLDIQWPPPPPGGILPAPKAPTGGGSPQSKPNS
jgi:MraZ protein